MVSENGFRFRAHAMRPYNLRASAFICGSISLLFSLGGSLAMMFGFSLAFAGAGHVELSALTAITVFPGSRYLSLTMPRTV